MVVSFECREEWLPLVKGTSRRVIVVDSPDPKLFVQAIFGEACRIARNCAASQTAPPPIWRRVPVWGWVAMAAGVAAAVLAVVL